MTDERFGSLVALEFIPGSGKTKAKWLCQCDCGNIKEIRADALRHGKAMSCGCQTYKNRYKDLSGQRFGRLTVLSYSHSDSHRNPHYLCLCDCGNEKVVNSAALKRGATVSCGCYNKEIITKHSMSGTPLWRMWSAMRSRCYKSYNMRYERYGARNITICDAWRDNAEAFIGWAQANGYMPGLSIERIDNDKGYEPSNCRFATALEQADNRSTTIHYEYHGMVKNIAEWARYIGMNEGTFRSRLGKGWSIEEAIETPINKRYSRY